MCSCDRVGVVALCVVMVWVWLCVVVMVCSGCEGARL